MKSIYYILGIVLILILGGFFVLSQENKTVNQDNTSGEEDIQEITLSYKDYNYYPQTISVNVNRPVRISADDSVRGCFRDFTIRELGVRKYLKSQSDYIEFTPSKTGTYVFACSMGMGTGKIIVK